MPFKSEKQRRFLWLKHPDIAKRWAHEYPNQKNLPTYARGSDNKKTEESESNAEEPSAKSAAIAIMRQSVTNYSQIPSPFARSLSVDTQANIPEKSAQIAKKSISIIQELNVPHSGKPVAAGEEHVTVKREKKDENTPETKALTDVGSMGGVEKSFNLADPEIKPTLQKLGELFQKHAVVIKLGPKHRRRHPDQPSGPNNVGINVQKLQAGVNAYRQQRAWAAYQATMFPQNSENSGKSQSNSGPVATYPGMQTQQSGQIAPNKPSMQSPTTNPVGMKGPLNTQNGVPTFAQNLTGNASFGKGSA